MALILNEKYSNYYLFLTNRLLRLMPMYWFLFFVGLLISYPLIAVLIALPYPFQLIFVPIVKDFGLLNSLLVAFSNLFVVGQDLFLFLGFDKASSTFYFIDDYRKSEYLANNFIILKQAWSVSLEIMFYIIAPLFARRRISVIIIIIILSLYFRLLLFFNGYDQDPFNYRFFPNELAVFFMGFLSYRFYRSTAFLKMSELKRYKYLFPVALLAATCSVGVPIKAEYNFITSSIYLIGLVFALPFLLDITKKNKFDNFIGELSYPIYLCHLITLNMLNTVYKAESYALLNVILSTVVSIALVLMFKPLESYRQKRAKLA